MRACIALAVVWLPSIACQEEKAPPPSVPAATAPADELALQVSDSVAIWFTSARTDSAADGTVCQERVMEIRRPGRSIPIPLLYTSEAPTVTSDSTIEVHVWLHCAPADLYRVNLRTGQPIRVGT